MARLLVIEDEPNIAGIILYKLRREGHDVEHASGVAAARALTGPWDLVLLDSSLPDEDALALVDDWHRAVPVVVMTESRDERTPVLATGRGAVAIVRKPFKPTLLARLVIEVTGAAKRDTSHSTGTEPRGLIAAMGSAEVGA